MAKLRESLPATANVKNPVDVIGDARADRYTAALEAVLDDPNVDQVLVILTPQSMTDIEAIAQGVCRIHEADGRRKPIACSFMGAADVGAGIHLAPGGPHPALHPAGMGLRGHGRRAEDPPVARPADWTRSTGCR